MYQGARKYVGPRQGGQGFGRCVLQGVCARPAFGRSYYGVRRECQGRAGVVASKSGFLEGAREELPRAVLLPRALRRVCPGARFEWLRGVFFGMGAPPVAAQEGAEAHDAREVVKSILVFYTSTISRTTVVAERRDDVRVDA